MAAYAIELADLVADDLTNAGLSITAERAYVPVVELKDISAQVKVLVVPNTKVSQSQTRDRSIYEFKVWVSVMQKLGTGSHYTFDKAALDALMQKVQDIETRLERRKLGDYSWIGTANEPIYDPEHLEQHRQFTSLLSVTYKR